MSALIGSTIVNKNDQASPLFTSIDELEENFSAQACSMLAQRPNHLSPAFLSRIWCINEERAEAALQSNSHSNRRSTDTSLSRHYSTNDRMLRYKRINSLFYTDTFFVTASGKSRPRGNTCMQLFVSDKGFIAVYPMQRKSQFQDVLHLFCKEIGVPDKLVVDPSGEQTSKPVKLFCQQVGLTLRILEESTQWANRAELYIGIIKEAIRKDLCESNCPLVLWNYYAE